MEKKPNKQLQHERELRGWSQARVAEKIGTTAKRVSMWECGDTSPDRYYQEALIKLFGKNAQELGFLKRALSQTAADDEPQEEERDTNDVQHPSAKIQDGSGAFSSKEGGLQGREQDQKQGTSIAYPCDEASYHALASYLHNQRERMLDTLAPGSTNLRVRDIIGTDGIFISPSWTLSQGIPTSSNVAQYLIDAVSQEQRILLVGEAGHGKTTILKQVFHLLVDRFLQSGPQIALVPLFIPLRDVAEIAGNALDILWTYVGEEFPLPFEEFATLVRNHHIVFLFDGFDEMRGDLTQRAINERSSSKIFTYPALLSCRKNFFELYLSLSALQELYPLRVELQPLPLTNVVVQYVRMFFEKRSGSSSQVMTISPENIVETILASKELSALAHIPLLLVMMVDIFTDPQQRSEGAWNGAKLYQKYTEKWLKYEAAKPDSVLRWHEKAVLLQEIAWSTYVAKASTTLSHELYQNVVFSRQELSDLLQGLFERYRYCSFAQFVDDVSMRTFLIAKDGESHYFIHKSFQDYSVAKYTFDRLRRREGQPDAAAQALQEFLSFDVVAFLKAMLGMKDFSRRECDHVVDVLIEAYQQNTGRDERSVAIREHASHYLAFLGTPAAVQFLEHTYADESNKWVQRGMMVGLALQCNRGDILVRYMEMVLADPETASINIGYHLVYYGDQPAEDGYYDRGGQRCDGTVRSIFRRLRSEYYRASWVLDLLTLRTLVEQRGVAILCGDEHALPFLTAFLGQDHQEQGSIFQQEKQRLQAFLKGAAHL